LIGRSLRAAMATIGYDPLFFSDELGKTFGEATAEEKDRVSHQGRAPQGLAPALKLTTG
jgi:XTP/dITP diphosphohydrolase